MMPLYTSWLTVADYGLTDIISVYVSLLIGVVTCCIGESLFIFPKGAPAEEQRKFFTSGCSFLAFAVLLAAAVFYVVDIFSQACNFKNSFTDNIWLIYFMLLSQIAQQISQQFVRSIDLMKVYSITGIVAAVSTAAYAFLLIPENGVEGFVWSIILANLTAGAFAIFASRSYRYFSFRFFDKKSLSTMLKYSLPLIPNGIMWWLVNAFNRPLLEAHLGMHDIGIYAVANKFPGVLGMVFIVFVTSWQISVLEEYGKNDFQKFYNKVFRLVWSGLLVVFIVLTLLSKVIVSIFAANEFFEAWRYVPLLTLGVFFSNISGFAGSIFSAVKQSKYFFYSSLWGAVIAVALNFALIPLFGLLGACFSVIISFAVMAVSRIIYSWKFVKLEKLACPLLLLLLSVALAILYIVELDVLYVLAASVVVVFVIASSNRVIIHELINKLRKKVL